MIGNILEFRGTRQEKNEQVVYAFECCCEHCVHLFDIPDFTCYRIDWSWELPWKRKIFGWKKKQFTFRYLLFNFRFSLSTYTKIEEKIVFNVGIFAEFQNARFDRPNIKSFRRNWWKNLLTCVFCCCCCLSRLGLNFNSPTVRWKNAFVVLKLRPKGNYVVKAI